MNWFRRGGLVNLSRIDVKAVVNCNENLNGEDYAEFEEFALAA